jgi:uncharacterized protein (DUF1697 family)
MGVRVALLRGVNVGGAGKLPMAGFRDLLAGLGLGQVRTYIQSGNAVFASDRPASELETMIRDAVAAEFGFAPDTFVLSGDDLAAALREHPFQTADPARVHVFFLAETPAALDQSGLAALAAPEDAWHLSGRRFTLHTPAGIGRSRVADKLHQFLPGQMTARNLRTLAALCAICAGSD